MNLDIISGAVRIESILAGYPSLADARYLGTVGVLTIAEAHGLAAMLKDAP